MKFAHAFDAALQQDEYPISWVNAAISYRKLKKCIKDVQRELTHLGLDSETLKELWARDDQGNALVGRFQYTFLGDAENFRPRLIFQVDTNSGIPMSASIPPATKDFLRALVSEKTYLPDTSKDNCGSNIHLQWNLPPRTKAEDSDAGSPETYHSETPNENQTAGSTQRPTLGSMGGDRDRAHELDPSRRSSGSLRAVEIPLTADSRFFQLLNLQIIQLSALQSREEAGLQGTIVALGDAIGSVAEPSNSFSKTDLCVWRDIFSLYTDSRIFFSTNEREKFKRNGFVAQQQLQEFSNKLIEQEVAKRFKKKASHRALAQFINLNVILLRHLKFQDLNITAMTKILKKFDKRTALEARASFPELVVAETFSSSTLAKSICFQVSKEIISLVPQMNDYLCPVCFNISFKPIRLKCNHIFCIRCLVVMQRAKDDHCPLCRGSAVMEADSSNLDIDMLIFLKKYFPTEVKAKQKQNEHDAAIDRYGLTYDRKCTLM